MELGLLRLATLLYLAATLVALVGIAVRQELPRRLLPRLLLGGLGVHAAAIIVRSVAGGHIAVTTFAEALSFLAAVLVAIFLAVQARRPLVALGAVVSPLAFGLGLAAYAAYSGARPLPPVLDSAWLPVHVVLATLGDAVFALPLATRLPFGPRQPFPPRRHSATPRASRWSRATKIQANRSRVFFVGAAIMC